MVTDFETMQWTENPNFKGGEGIFRNKVYDDGVNKMMQGLLKPGCSIGYHKHEGNSEIIFLVKGTGKLIQDGVESEVKAGQCLYCPEGHEHSLISVDEDLMFYSVIPTA